MTFQDLRESVIPLPKREDGYRRVLMLGTTGAGKTTVVRQLLGTHPKTERFPSTSTAKTTVADTEIIPVDEPNFRAVVTFMPQYEVEDHLLDNVMAAAQAIFEGADDQIAYQKLLDHEGQRFRLSYLLGRPVVEDDDDDIDDDQIDDEIDDVINDEVEDDVSGGASSAVDDSLPNVDVAHSRRVVEDAVRLVRGIVKTASLRGVVAPGDEELHDHDNDDNAVYEALQEAVANSPTTDTVVNMLVKEVADRFTAFPYGEFEFDEEGWPSLWTQASSDRRRFLAELAAFYGNAAAHFGRLLTPVVNGMRVSGPFIPTWSTSPLRLVIVDSEGLGHTPSSISSLSSSLVRKVGQSDSVLVVDNGQQPMQAGPLAAMTQIVESGSVAKLHLLFTHLDAVKGANLTGHAARTAHVRESVENAVKSIETTAGPAAARALRRRIDTSVYYAGNLDRVMSDKDIFGRKGAAEFSRLRQDLEGEDVARDHGDAEVVVARKGVVIAVEEATTRFQDAWLTRLGAKKPGSGSEIRAEHWSRIKALNRRIANELDDEYQDLKPVGDFRRELQHALYTMLQNPVRWQGQQIADDERTEVVDTIANAMAEKVVVLAEERIIASRARAWTAAWVLSGKGSTGRRAEILAEDVVRAGAPVPTADLSPDAMVLIDGVEKVLDEVQADHHLVVE